MGRCNAALALNYGCVRCVPIAIAQAWPEFSRSFDPASCVTIIAGMATAEKSPVIFDGAPIRLFVMTTATAPAAWALLAFSAKSQSPRRITLRPRVAGERAPRAGRVGEQIQRG